MLGSYNFFFNIVVLQTTKNGVLAGNKTLKNILQTDRTEDTSSSSKGLGTTGNYNMSMNNQSNLSMIFFYSLFISVLPLGIQLSRCGWNPINWFNTATFVLAVPRQDVDSKVILHGFFFMFIDLR